MAHDDYLDRLADVPLFADLDRKHLEAVASLGTDISIEEGRELAHEGDAAAEAFLVIEGTARAERDGAEIATLGPGDFFGEMALADDDRRTATVTATSPMTLIVLTGAKFRAIDESMPQLHALVAGAIRRRRAPVT